MFKFVVASAIALLLITNGTSALIDKRIIRTNKAEIHNIGSDGNTVIIAGGNAATVRSINQLVNGLDGRLEDAINDAIANDPLAISGDNLQAQIDDVLNSD